MNLCMYNRITIIARTLARMGWGWHATRACLKKGWRFVSTSPVLPSYPHLNQPHQVGYGFYDLDEVLYEEFCRRR